MAPNYILSNEKQDMHESQNMVYFKQLRLDSSGHYKRNAYRLLSSMRWFRVQIDDHGLTDILIIINKKEEKEVSPSPPIPPKYI